MAAVYTIPPPRPPYTPLPFSPLLLPTSLAWLSTVRKDGAVPFCLDEGDRTQIRDAPFQLTGNVPEFHDLLRTLPCPSLWVLFSLVPRCRGAGMEKFKRPQFHLSVVTSSDHQVTPRPL